MGDLQRSFESVAALAAQAREGGLEVRLVAFSPPLRLEEQDYFGRQRNESKR